MRSGPGQPLFPYRLGRDGMRITNAGSIHFIDPPGMRCVQIVRGVDVTNEFPRHVHDRFCVGLVCRGARVIWHEGGSVTVPENGLFIINPGAAHACKSLDRTGHSYLAVCIDVEKMQRIASQICGKPTTAPIFKKIVYRDPELASEARRLHYLLGQADSKLLRKSAITSMFSKLILRYADIGPLKLRGGPQKASIDRARQYIETHFAHNPSLDQLARIAGLSPFHFHRQFLRNRGISPHEYLIQVKIKTARKLLTQGASIAGVAHDLGFADQSHFSRFFKRAIGVSPGRFIRLQKGRLFRDAGLLPRSGS